MRYADAAKLRVGNKIEMRGKSDIFTIRSISPYDKGFYFELHDGSSVNYRKIRTKIMSHVIFLDVDGVLNTDATTEKTPVGYIGIDLKYVECLSKLVDMFNADVVLTSDWKDEWNSDYKKCDVDGKYLCDKLLQYNIMITDKTVDRSVGNDYSSGRGKGIHDYLDKHPTISHWVVLDDNFFGDFDYEIQQHVIMAGVREGFSEDRLKEAIDAMNDVVMYPQEEFLY